MKVKINGFSYDEVREFEILEREKVESILDEIEPADIFRSTMEIALGYFHSGTAYTFLDARDGKIKTSWLGSNSFNHPWDSFYEIVLCRLETGSGRIDLDTAEMLLERKEQEEYKNYSGNIREYLTEKYGKDEYKERIENAIDYLCDDFEVDWDDIKEQLNNLYSGF